MSAQPVDVRAVMNRAYTALYVAAEDEEGSVLAEDVLQLGAVLAELIEAARDEVNTDERFGFTYAEKVERLRIALARIRGA